MILVVGLWELLEILLVSILAGLVGAVFGLGGGVLIIPFLTLVEGIPVPLAVGASLVSVVATSSASAATYVQDRLTNLRLGMFLEVGTVAGAITGAYVSILLPNPVLLVLFGAILLYATFVIISNRRIDFPAGVVPDRLSKMLRLASEYPDKVTRLNIKYDVTRTRQTLGISYVAGIVSGLLGIGGGAISVPTMNLLSKVPIKVASATSNFMIGVTAAASGSVYFLRGDVHPLLVAPLMIGVVGGAFVGTRVLQVTAPRRVKVAFGILLGVVSILMILKGLGLPVVL